MLNNDDFIIAIYNFRAICIFRRDNATVTLTVTIQLTVSRKRHGTDFPEQRIMGRGIVAVTSMWHYGVYVIHGKLKTWMSRCPHEATLNATSQTFRRPRIARKCLRSKRTWDVVCVRLQGLCGIYGVSRGNCGRLCHVAATVTHSLKLSLERAALLGRFSRNG